MVTYLGETDILKNMCEKFNIPTGSVYNYMYSHNYECNINEAFEYCVKHYKPIVRPKVGDKIGILCCSNGQKKSYKEKIGRLEDTLRTIGLEPIFCDYIYEKELRHGRCY